MSIYSLKHRLGQNDFMPLNLWKLVKSDRELPMAVLLHGQHLSPERCRTMHQGCQLPIEILRRVALRRHDLNVDGGRITVARLMYQHDQRQRCLCAHNLCPIFAFFVARYFSLCSPGSMRIGTSSTTVNPYPSMP